MKSTAALAAATAAGAASQIVGGIADMSAGRKEAALQEQEAKQALLESEEAAVAKEREVQHFQSEQAHKYASSGITLEGTPALVLAETKRLGQQEVDAIRRKGQAQANLLRMRAGQTRNTGRSSLLSSIVGAGASGVQTYALGKYLGLFGSKTAGKSPIKASGLPDINNNTGRYV